ncbi:FluC/FEX family fluoride channel ASCRUDRAFT_22309, partial [Ascoidea rubescens DSM 1968]
LCFFSILGSLSRLGVGHLACYNNSYISGIIWSNFLSCFLMGLFKFIKTDIKHINLLRLGMTTGYCGSFSSFSSLILEAVLLTLSMTNKENNLIFNDNAYNSYPNKAYGLLNLVLFIIAQFSLSFSGYLFGLSIANEINNRLSKRNDLSGNKSSNKQRRLAPFLIVLELFGIIFWIVFIFLSIFEKSWRHVTVANCFAPLACYLRYILSFYFNNKFAHVKFLGTFLANLIATILISIFIVLNRSSGFNLIGKSFINCQMLVALSDGFCAVLSTVSTFILELHSQTFLDALTYGSISIIVCFLLSFAIIGSYNWTIGL